eukprot:TRINITY_DN92735_c0_g1_i1.p1 TRINITY_DN92735_c0_g1~~TRINITY_DN92735_c0_g1_i1.p1  ORF type:complete len:106 (+),score=5.85 TRINITY_DN92735_c0_g1_i1:43-318(+)
MPNADRHQTKGGAQQGHRAYAMCASENVQGTPCACATHRCGKAEPRTRWNLACNLHTDKHEQYCVEDPSALEDNPAQWAMRPLEKKAPGPA